MITTSEALLTEMRQFIDGSVPRIGDIDVRRLEDHRKDPASNAGPPSNDLAEQMVAESRRDAERFETSPRAHVNLGFALMNRRQLAEAQDEFKAALALDESNYLAGLGLGRTQLLLGAIHDAHATLSRLVNSFPNEAAPLLGLSEIAFHSGDIEESLSWLRRAVKMTPSSVLARYHLATVLMHARHYAAAIAEFRRALKDNPRSSWLYHSLGVAYALQRELRKARRAFESALELMPGMNDAVKALAKVLLEQGELEAATEILNEQIHRQPRDPELRELLAWAYINQKEYRKARTELYQALTELSGAGKEADLQRWRLSNNLGVCYAYMRERDLAETFFARSIELLPEAGPLPYNNLARLYLQTQHVDAAHSLAVRTLKLFPEDPDAPIVSAFSLTAQDRNGEAIEVLRRALGSDQSRPMTYAVLAALLSDSSDAVEEAGAVIDEARARFPKDPLVANNYAYVHLLRGETSPARAALSSINEDDLQVPGLKVAITATRGLLCFHERKLKAGIELYKRAARIARENGNAILPLYVLQKMHLELAKAYERSGEMESFAREVREGLGVKLHKGPYRRQLLRLSSTLLNSNR